MSLPGAPTDDENWNGDCSDGGVEREPSGHVTDAVTKLDDVCVILPVESPRVLPLRKKHSESSVAAPKFEIKRFRLPAVLLFLTGLLINIYVLYATLKGRALKTAPSASPSGFPSAVPTSAPSGVPTQRPSISPSGRPTSLTSFPPTKADDDNFGPQEYPEILEPTKYQSLPDVTTPTVLPIVPSETPSHLVTKATSQEPTKDPGVRTRPEHPANDAGIILEKNLNENSIQFSSDLFLTVVMMTFGCLLMVPLIIFTVVSGRRRMETDYDDDYGVDSDEPWDCHEGDPPVPHYGANVLGDGYYCYGSTRWLRGGTEATGTVAVEQRDMVLAEVAYPEMQGHGENWVYGYGQSATTMSTDFGSSGSSEGSQWKKKERPQGRQTKKI
eukprot:CAMPEP_0194268360 /NCGR_PEP_ID=MMETSP0169-20130528/2707_1 /TAXON_ID=218684 /ORGANISM="Corethron pennatum, Strain L29A3" /LENGTH=384 /DNA_ID=CAMNT_0039009569 /DNA_START=128 /DNA_END=1283 /DNA_ORIENTATION=+